MINKKDRSKEHFKAEENVIMLHRNTIKALCPNFYTHHFAENSIRLASFVSTVAGTAKNLKNYRLR